MGEDSIFEVLGYKVKQNKDRLVSESGVDIVDIIQRLENEAKLLDSSDECLDKGQRAILVALKIAHDCLALEGEYQKTVGKLQGVAMQALQIIDDSEKEAHSSRNLDLSL